MNQPLKISGKYMLILARQINFLETVHWHNQLRDDVAVIQLLSGCMISVIHNIKWQVCD